MDADDIVEKIVQSQNFADINNTEGTAGVSVTVENCSAVDRVNLCDLTSPIQQRVAK